MANSIRFIWDTGHAGLWAGYHPVSRDPCQGFPFFVSLKQSIFHFMTGLNAWLVQCLSVISFILGFADQAMARNFYIVIGVVIIIVRILTDYEGKA